MENNRFTIHSFPQHYVSDNITDSVLPEENDDTYDVSKRYSDPEMSLKDRQTAINLSHPFGMKLWKPALYKKHRTIENITNLALHQTPSSQSIFQLVSFGNVLWSIMFGFPLAIFYIALAIIYFVFTFPLLFTVNYAAKARTYNTLLLKMAFYMLWPFGNYVFRIRDASPIYETLIVVDTFDSADDDETDSLLRDSLDRQKIIFDYSDTIYRALWWVLIAPMHYIVSGLNFLMVVSIPMAKLNYIIPTHLRKNPLSIDISFTVNMHPSCEILLCTYEAFGLQYYKYTYDGINIIFINLLLFVVLALGNGYVLGPYLNHVGIAHPLVIFGLCLVAVIPLAYFIGMAVASISSQSSLGFGAVINATFGSIVEIILYCLMIVERKGILVEGAIIGSIIGTLLLLPGLSMIAGGIGKWKEQKFNVKSAGVSTVLLIMALIGAFTPTLVYSVFGGHELVCSSCPSSLDTSSPEIMKMKCQGCSYQLPHNLSTDPFYVDKTRPLMYWCAAILPSAYVLGLLFTLKTHSNQIYDKKHEPPLLDYSEGGNVIGNQAHHGSNHHDAPEWGKTKSMLVLLVSTVLFSLLAELLVDTVDSVTTSLNLDPKFLGLTLFALVPSFTEFLNAIMFARQGNVALSLEIGSAYVVQIALIQIPVLVAFSAFWNWYEHTPDTPEGSFTLIFPQWDCYSVFFAVFLLSYTYIEGKSNYFKGGIMTLSYLVLILGFFYV